MSTEEFDQLANSSDSWYCPHCGNPNHSMVLYDIPASMADSVGSIYSSDEDATCSTPNLTHGHSLSDMHMDSSTFSLGSPAAASSPKPTPHISHNRQKHFRVVSVNFQSIRKKGRNIDVLVETVSPDVIIGTETWLSNDINSSEFFNPSLGYNVFRNDRKSDPHGGVLIAVKNNLEFTNVTSSSNIEFISGTLQLPKKKQMVIGAYFRPPDRVDEEYLSQTYKEISSLKSTFKKAIFIIAGDFNAPDIQWSDNTITGNSYPRRVSQCFLDLTHDLSMEQMVDFPTRFENTLDLVLVSHPAFMTRCKPLPPIGNKSDHDIVLYDTTHQAVRLRPQRRKISFWKKVNPASIKSAISDLCKSCLDGNFSSLDDMWIAFKSGILDIIDKQVPSKLSSARFTHPWVSTKTRRLTRRKARAYRKAKTSRKKVDWDRYLSLKSETQREMRRAHNNFIKDTVNQDITNNSKRFWSYVKSKKQESFGISPLLNQDGFLHSSSHNKAEILNKQFQSAFTRENLNNIPDMGPSNIPSMAPIHISTPGITKLLKNLKPHKASGPDGVPTRLLLLAADEVSPMLTRIFQTSLDTGSVPKDWREALITPIFKKGARNIASNYRPVSLTSVVSKLLEHIIFSATMKHLTCHNILTSSQHGFRSKRSCETQLISTIHGIAKSLKSGKDQVDVILLDFAKAFDKVPFKRLLHKLHFYGIRHNTLQWISSFLNDRSQQVLVEGSKSEKLEVLSGVPQGTVLGPLLFLVYINDLPSICRSSHARLFADDTLLYKHIRNNEDSTKLQEDLAALEDWESKWQMSFHPEKCSILRISTSKRYQRDTNYYLHGQRLQVVDSGKYLGVTLSDDLQWDKHTQATAAKSSRSLGFLRRNFRDCSREVRETTYKTMVRSSMEYAATVWDPYKVEDINRLDKVQRRAARFVCNNYTDRTPGCVTAMVNKLGWDDLQDRRRVLRLTMLFKITHGLVDIPEASDIIKTSDRRTRGSQRLFQPFTNVTVYKLSFFPRTIQDWNKLPTSTTDLSDIEDFKAALHASVAATPLSLA
ncbi:MAG: reverse transcriptase domain-containing protein [Candidatus Thiodiazotropha endolucinida]|nr:hypothetical protein [Candidatus Thiodiazotropha taylori]MCW4261721.1 reverse transcriptase domain-containing protein [Candidatus Thiodiazotropha endolucinida]